LIVGDGLAHKVQSHFTKQLESAGDHVSGFDCFIEFSCPEPEQNNQDNHHDQTNHHDSVDCKRGALEGNDLGIKLKNTRRAKFTALCRKQAQHTKQLRSPGPGGVITSAR
jgi:hypothetical protein